MSLKEDIKAYDQRQLKLMIQFINDYENGKTSFVGLGESLEALIACLQNIDDTWKKEALLYAGFLTGISDLMIVDNQIDKFANLEEQGDAKESIDKLIKLIEPLIIKNLEE